MSNRRNIVLSISAALVLLGALLHLAIPLGGPSWYRSFGAPERLAQMAEAGALRPVITCIVIAACLIVIAAYGFSGTGRIRPLPLLRPVLAIIGIGLIVRGVSFFPLAIWWPQVLGRLCGNCHEVNAFLVVTSALCLFVGVGYLAGARATLSSSAHRPGVAT